jgi:hypothetical protein
LDALAAARQARVIRFFESVPIRLLRIGTWGVKTLVFMGYYGQPEIARRAGYVPAFDGNGAIGEGKRV